MIRKKKALEEQASKSASSDQGETAGIDGPERDVPAQSAEEVDKMEQNKRLLREKAKREELEALRAKLKKLEL